MKVSLSYSPSYSLLPLILLICVKLLPFVTPSTISPTISPTNTSPTTSYSIKQRHLYSHLHLLLSEILSLPPHDTIVNPSDSSPSIIPTLQSSTTSPSFTTPLPQTRAPSYALALSTKRKPYPCLYSYTTPPNTIVISPVKNESLVYGVGDDVKQMDPNEGEWVGLKTLLRLYRTSPSSIEPLFHSKYPLTSSLHNPWFSPTTSISQIQHRTLKGNLVKKILDAFNDKNGVIARYKYARFAFEAFLAYVAVYALRLQGFLKYIIYNSINSSPFWGRHGVWSRIMYAPLPLKLYIAQLLGAGWEKVEGKVGGIVRDWLVEIEAEEIEKGFMEEVGGRGGEVEEEEEEDEEEEEYEEEYVEEYDDDDEEE